MQMSQWSEPRAQRPRSEPLELVVVNDFASVTGGSDRVALGDAGRLAQRGHRVTLVAGQGEPERELVDAGVTVRTTGQRSTIEEPSRLRAAGQGMWNRASARLLAEVLENADPARTVIHVHGFTKVLSASVVRTAVRSGLPVVATLHDYFAACPNGGFFNYQTDEICHLTPLSPRCVATHCDIRSYSHKLWRVGRTALQRSAGAMPRGVRDLVVPSRFAGEILRPFLPGGSRLHVIPNPVPADRAEAVQPSTNDAFVFLGRLARDKGPVRFAQAAREAGVRAVFVGDGEEREAIRRANPDAELTGWLGGPGVQAQLRRARAVVSASLWYETQGLSPLEAAANGVPAIVPDTSVLREFVADGRSGLWYRGGDRADLAQKLSQLSTAPALADRLGAAAYEGFWAGGWDVATHLARLDELYRAVL